MTHPSPEDAQEAFDAYANLIRLTAMQNPKSIADVIKGIRSNPKLTPNQKEALSAYAHIERQIAVASELPPQTTSEAAPSQRPLFFSGGRRR